MTTQPLTAEPMSHIPVHGLPQWPSGVKAVREDDDVILRGGGGGATPRPFSLLLSLFLLVLLSVFLSLRVGLLTFICDGIKKTERGDGGIFSKPTIKLPSGPQNSQYFLQTFKTL